MVDLINRVPEDFIFNFTGNVMSAAFNLAVEINCEKHLLEGTTGMAHLFRVEASLDALGNVIETDKKYVNSLIPDKEYAKKYLSLYKKCGMSEDELKRIKSGEDLYFTYSRMKKFIK